jgi:formylglycine-generating enzyme required for sulfatase activity
METMGIGTPTTSGAEFYLARALRHVPVEALAAYLALENILELQQPPASPGGAVNAAAGAWVLSALIFTAFVVVVVIYYRQQSRALAVPSYSRTVLAVMGFTVWSFAIGTSVFLPPQGILSALYDSTFAAALLVAYTVAAALFAGPASDDVPPIRQSIPFDGYADRTAKYLPAEALGLYLAAQNLLGFKSVAVDRATSVLPVPYLAFAAFVLCLLSIPLVLWTVGRPLAWSFGRSWLTQSAISMVGFLVWVYAIGGRLLLPGLGQLEDWHNGFLAAVLLIAFTFGSGLVTPSTSRPERPRLNVFSAYAIAIAVGGAGMVLLLVRPRWIEGLGLNVLVLSAISLGPLLVTAYVFHCRALVAILKSALPACAAVVAVVYGLARLALLDLAVPPSPTIVPGDGHMEHGHAVAIWIDRDGAARLDRDGATVTIDRRGAPVRQAFLLADATATLTVDRNGAARIVDVNGAGPRSALDLPPVVEIVRAQLWGPYLAPVARLALLVTAQVLPLEIPEPVRGRRGRAFRDCAACPEMIEINRGYFLMGSPLVEAGRYSDEFPRRLVSIEQPFAIGRFAVTFDEWEACVADKGCTGNQSPGDSGWGRGRRPVIDISWNDAQDYVTWLSGKTGKRYRLLSEAEWEYAARAGSTAAYAFGNKIGKGNANCDGCGSQWDRRQTAPVGSFPANAFGLHDMHGNVWEWVEDCYHSSYAGLAASTVTGGQLSVTDCEKDGNLSSRVLRGGSWGNHPVNLRSAIRYRIRPVDRDYTVGFRVARTL